MFVELETPTLRGNGHRDVAEFVALSDVDRTLGE